MNRANQNYLFWFMVLSLSILMGVGNVFFSGNIERVGYELVRSGGTLSALFMPLMAGLYSIAGLVLLRKWRTFVRMLNQNRALVLLLCYALLSTFWSVAPIVTAIRAVSLIGTTAIAFAFLIALRNEQQMRCLRYSFLVFLSSNILIIALDPSTGMHQLQHEGAWRGTLTHKNNFGWLAAVAVIFFLHESIAEKTTGRITSWIALVFSVVFLAASSSATAAAGLGAALVLYVQLRLTKQTGRFKAAILFISVGLAFTVLMLAQVLFEWVLTMLGRSATLTGRTHIWQALNEVIAARPWFGHGYAAFWESDLVEQAMANAFITSHAHNGYYDLLVDLGVVGLCLFVLTITPGYLGLLKQHYTKEASILLVMTAAILVIGFSGGVILANNTFYWLIMVVMVAKRRESST